MSPMPNLSGLTDMLANTVKASITIPKPKNPMLPPTMQPKVLPPHAQQPQPKQQKIMGTPGQPAPVQQPAQPAQMAGAAALMQPKQVSAGPVQPSNPTINFNFTPQQGA